VSRPKGLRVIAGSARGRKLAAPLGDRVRPTKDMVREAMFSALDARGALVDATVLDLYAGTGALGIEAISRGASMVTFVERDRRAQALIARNLAHCGVTDGYDIIRALVVHAIGNFVSASFDIILFDPPYDDAPEEAMAAAGEVLAPGGVLVLEHARRRTAAESAGSLVRVRQVIAGDSALSFYACPP
jgi:16S rRNA (guanine966-N2)-methyltransferase